PDKKVIYFAIGFETTTPMTAALIERAIQENIKNIYFHINHVLVPPPVKAIMDSGEAKIDAFIAPSHVSVITGAKIYKEIVDLYKTPVVVAGFEPVDIMESILWIIRQFKENRREVEIQYKRAVSWEGNTKAQEMVNKYMEPRETFRWRGIGDIPYSALKLKDEYAEFDAEKVFADILPNQPIDDHKLCICGDILKGIAKPYDCRVFGTACTPQNPLGSCMVSSEGACAAYYKYGKLQLI
ncbi:MAG: hydrogenase formation protein HypD, partial [Persephonella sp.]